MEVICPVCRCECEEFYIDCNGEIVGCNNCAYVVDAYEHTAAQMELEADYYHETFMSDR